MAKSKKGISPLIATVLIIGLTVVLAALVAMWTTQFTKDTTKNVGAKSEQQLACIEDVSLNIKGSCAGNGYYDITVENSGIKDVTALNIRLYASGTDVESKVDLANSNVPKFDVKVVRVPTSKTGIKMIEIMP